MRRGILLLLPWLAATCSSVTAAARPFGWSFGDRSSRRFEVAHMRRRAAQDHTEAPVPVPRPHFATDQPTPAVADPSKTATSGSPAYPPRSEVSSPDAQTEPSATSLPPTSEAASAPTPPPRPSELAQPGTSATNRNPPDSTSKAVAPSGATTAFTPRQPAIDDGCLDRLKKRQAISEPIDIGKQPDDRCTVVQPVRLSSFSLPEGGTVTFPDRPIIACTTADTFTAYVRDLLAPLAKGSFGMTLTSIWTGPGLECRSRDHIFGAKLSAHGQGLAVDIAQLKLSDGRMIEVGTPRSDADVAFEVAARAGGCGYFHTVLGPGSDAYHRTHWHFDLEVRGKDGDSKYCK